MKVLASLLCVICPFDTGVESVRRLACRRYNQLSLCNYSGKMFAIHNIPVSTRDLWQTLDGQLPA